jgi:hypothetical protein
MVADWSDAWLQETCGGDSNSDKDAVEVFKSSRGPRRQLELYLELQSIRKLHYQARYRAALVENAIVDV